LNAGQIYADGYNGSYVSSDGKYDHLFRINFVSYIKLLKGLMAKLRLQSTRVVFVSSVAHFVGVPADIVKPNLSKKTTSAQQMTAYSTSKMAFSTLQQVLAKDGLLPNSVAVSHTQSLHTAER
jgi:NAD(P)-dependent dehydrogenase (short-subunit alcohol dehydrogenase family)